MQTARILRAFGTASGQWLNPGLLVQAPPETVQAWLDAGLAEPIATSDVAADTPKVATQQKSKRSKLAA